MTSLTDGSGRSIDYLRLSLTDRCDLRCRYCIPEGFHDFEAPAGWLTPTELERTVSTFAALGMRRVRLTGGEPLTRREVVEIATRIAGLPGIDDLSLTTNGTRLWHHATALQRAGVRRLNISLDSLDPNRFREITGHGALSGVLAGIETALDEGFDLIKINMVVMAGINEDETEAMVEYCMARGLVLRLIEPMPMGDSGRNVRPADLGAIRRRLQTRFDLVDGVVPGGGPARYQQSRDGQFSIGFITPMSQHFCATCNRVRLSAEGTLFTCLGQNDSFDLGHLIRTQASQEDVMEAIRLALMCKPERHDFNDAPGKVVRIMAKTGG